MNHLDGLKIILNGTSEERDIRKLGKKANRIALRIYPPKENPLKDNLDKKMSEFQALRRLYSGQFSGYFKKIALRIEDNKKLAQGHNMPRYR